LQAAIADSAASTVIVCWSFLDKITAHLPVAATAIGGLMIGIGLMKMKALAQPALSAWRARTPMVGRLTARGASATAQSYEFVRISGIIENL
jgi:hypothetical protein